MNGKETAQSAMEASMSDQDVQALRAREQADKRNHKFTTSIALLEYRVGQLEAEIKKVHADNAAITEQLRDMADTLRREQKDVFEALQKIITAKFAECQMVRRQENQLLEAEREKRKAEKEAKEAEDEETRRKRKAEDEAAIMANPWVNRAISFAIGLGAAIAGFFGFTGGNGVGK